MPIKAQVIQHSVAPHGKELITFQLQYPRIIHGEIMTHRVFSRNAMSSRAVPVKKMIEQVKNDPFVPLHWGANQPGMQAHEQINLERRQRAEAEWRRAARHAAYFAESLNAEGLHKQVVNRVLEPFQWMHTIVSYTEGDNFYALRRHGDAEPHFQMLANAMWEAKEASTPVQRGNDPTNVWNWHLPYVTDEERAVASRALQDSAGGVLAMAGSARCARVSFLNHDGTNPKIEKDIELYQRLAGSDPIHASPLEHVAYPAEEAYLPFGNFQGWVQWRKLVEQYERMPRHDGVAA